MNIFLVSLALSNPASPKDESKQGEPETSGLPGTN